MAMCDRRCATPAFRWAPSCPPPATPPTTSTMAGVLAYPAANVDVNGASAGSTAGGIKVVRTVLMGKVVRRKWCTRRTPARWRWSSGWQGGARSHAQPGGHLPVCVFRAADAGHADRLIRWARFHQPFFRHGQLLVVTSAPACLWWARTATTPDSPCYQIHVFLPHARGQAGVLPAAGAVCAQPVAQGMIDAARRERHD